MKCQRCKTQIGPDDQREHLGKTLCEDCYMEALSPVRTCDPWAVHSAKSFEQHSGGSGTLTSVQSDIMRILKESGSIEPAALLEMLDDKLTLKELEREFATLRHMEKARGKRQGSKVVWQLW